MFARLRVRESRSALAVNHGPTRECPGNFRPPNRDAARPPGNSNGTSRNIRTKRTKRKSLKNNQESQ